MAAKIIFVIAGIAILLTAVITTGMYNGSIEPKTAIYLLSGNIGVCVVVAIIALVFALNRSRREE